MLLRFLLLQKDRISSAGNIDDLEAFCALGGNRDKTGQVETLKLQAIINDFELSIDIEELIKEYDVDNSGFIDFAELASMLKDDDDEAN